jgi:hypothetical protein
MKKIGMLVFMMIIMAVVMTAQAKVRTEYRAGGLPPLLMIILRIVQIVHRQQNNPLSR